jgi:hypothetical protein
MLRNLQWNEFNLNHAYVHYRGGHGPKTGRSAIVEEEEDVRYDCYKQSDADLMKGNTFCHVILLFQNKVSELVFCSY